MKMSILKYPLMNEAGDDGGDGGGGGGEPSSLNSGEQYAELMSAVPEKFHAFAGEGDDKTFDVSSTLNKVNEGYTELEKQFRSGNRGEEDLPESPDGYKVEAEAFGEGFDTEAFMKRDMVQGFLKGAHAKGIGNKSIQFVLENIATKLMPAMSAERFNKDAAASDQQLAEVFKGEQGADMAKGFARKALSNLTGSNERLNKALVDKFQNDPDFIEFASLIGREMKEDSPANIDKITGGVSIDSLMASEAYLQNDHPGHKAAVEQVAKYFEAKHGNAPAL